MFRSELVLESLQLTPSEITQKLGIAADRITGIGERRTVMLPPARTNSWIKEVRRGSDTNLRVDEACAIITSWGLDLAARIGRLADEGVVSVALSILQDIDDIEDPQQLGIHFDLGAIRWLAAAGAEVDIDQYLPG